MGYNTSNINDWRLFIFIKNYQIICFHILAIVSFGLFLLRHLNKVKCNLFDCFISSLLSYKLLIDYLSIIYKQTSFSELYTKYLILLL